MDRFNARESIEIFIRALGEDEMRLTAETILCGFGAAARSALIAAALDRGNADRSESESQLRKRRSALGLLLEIGIPRKKWPILRPLMEDRDRQIALLTCQFCFQFGSPQDLARSATRLIDLRSGADWLERDLIDELLKAIRFASSGD